MKEVFSSFPDFFVLLLPPNLKNMRKSKIWIICPSRWGDSWATKLQTHQKGGGNSTFFGPGKQPFAVTFHQLLLLKTAIQLPEKMVLSYVFQGCAYVFPSTFGFKAGQTTAI